MCLDDLSRVVILDTKTFSLFVSGYKNRGQMWSILCCKLYTLLFLSRKRTSLSPQADRWEGVSGLTLRVRPTINIDHHFVKRTFRQVFFFPFQL